MQPLAEVQKRMQAIQVPVFDKPEFISALERLAEKQQEFAKAIAGLEVGLPNVFERIAQIGRSTKGLDDAGWLPHHSTPFDQVEHANGDAASLNALLSGYYRVQWREVRKAIETRLAQYGIIKAVQIHCVGGQIRPTGVVRVVCYNITNMLNANST